MSQTVTKNRKAEVGKYSYQYVDIAQIHEYLESIGASYYQYITRIDGDDYVMTVKIIKGEEKPPLMGARVVNATLNGVSNPAQEQGSALTYARRYSLLMAFGLATEDDDAQSLSRPKKATENQVKFLATRYQGEYLQKLLAVNKIERLEDISFEKASELIGRLKGNA